MECRSNGQVSVLPIFEMGNAMLRPDQVHAGSIDVFHVSSDGACLRPIRCNRSVTNSLTHVL
jgi:hypothetical protein